MRRIGDAQDTPRALLLRAVRTLVAPSGSFNADLLAVFTATNARRLSQLMCAHADAHGADSMIADLAVSAVGELERLWAAGLRPGSKKC